MAQRITTVPIIHIHKEAGKRKDAVRINDWGDIPKFLLGTVTIDPFKEEVVLACVEGESRCPLGSVVGYERSETTDIGWNAWYIANAATNLVERDGAFFTKATILEAQEITDEAPEILRGANIWRNGDGSWSLGASWGTQTGWPGKAYWVKSGEDEDGVPKGYILTKSEESFELFSVCDDNGEDLCTLPEWDKAHA